MEHKFHSCRKIKHWKIQSPQGKGWCYNKREKQGTGLEKHKTNWKITKD